MKKLLGILATAILIASSTFVSASAAGDNGIYFYDFTGYSAKMNSGIGPDENWKALLRNNISNYGSYDTGDEHGTAMLIKPGSEPSFVFPEMLTTGKVHIGFDAKMTTDGIQALIMFYNGVYSEPSLNSFGKPLFINFPKGGLSNYTNAVTWGQKVLDEKIDATQWHHYDFRTTELSGSAVTMSCYIDGKLIYSDLNIKQAKGIRTWSFRAQKETNASAGENDGVIIDNVYVNTYSGSDSFSAKKTDNERIPFKNGRVRIAANERIKDGISKDNVIITNTNTGANVTNLSIENFTGQTFDIVFGGTIEYGRYNISFKDVAGEISGESLSSVISVETEYKSELIQNEYINLDFDDYTSNDGSLPSGFERMDSGDDVYAKSVSGKSGGANDFALGFSGMPLERKQKRVMYKFDSPIDENTEFDISLDMYTSNATWYLYLADEDDFSTDNSDYLNNSLVSVDEDGILYYANGRKDSPDTRVDRSLKLASDNWHNIKIKVIPDPDNNKNYLVISVDGGSEYRVETSREFHKNSVWGIGTGYLKMTDGDADVRVDNIKISGEKSVLYPEVDSIKAYDSFGNEVALSETASALIYEIRFEFNTLIPSDLDAFISMTKLGENVPVNYEVISDRIKQRSTIVIKFDDLLEKLRDYKITVSKGIPSIYSDKVQSFSEYTTEIKANRESAFKCKDFGYDSANGTARVVFSKNNDKSGTYIYVVAEYKTVTKNTADGEKQTELLTGIRYVPIILTAEDRGKFEYSLNLSNRESGTTFKTFVWTYPKLEKLIYAEDGTVEE